MIKKWSYVVATVATVLGGACLTGCIDNDEPIGIQQIRVETANLLKAKQAAVAAEAASSEAANEIAKLEIELKKTELEIARLKAESEAKINEMLAAAEAAKTEAEAEVLKAQAEAIIEKAKAEAEAIRLKAQSMADLVQTKIDKANFQLKKLEEQWEAEKIKNAAAENDKLYLKLKIAYNKYIAQLKVVNDATYQVAQAQSEYAKVMSNLVWDKENNTFSAPYSKGENSLKGQVANFENDIAQYEKTLEMFNTAKEAAENSELNTLLSQYEADLAKNVEELGKAQAELDAIYVKNQADFENAKALEQEYNNYYNKEISIPAYTYEPSAGLQSIGVEKKQIVPALAKYKFGEENNGYYTAYDQYINAYQSQINLLNRYVLDTNDKAWTAARVNEMTNELKAAETTFAPKKAVWEAAVATYNNGDTPDPAGLKEYGQEAVTSAVEAYNAQEEILAPLVQAVVDAKEVSNDAYEAYLKAYDAYYGNNGTDPTNAAAVALKAYNEAVNTKNAAYDEAEANYNEAVNSAFQTKKAALDAEYEKLYAAGQDELRAADQLQLAKDQLNGYTGSDEATKTSLQEAVTAAQTAYDSAEEAKDNAQTAYNEALEDANESYDAAIRKAQKEKLDAEHAAWKVFDKAESDYNAAIKGLQDVNDPAWKEVNDLNQDYQAKDQELQDAKSALESAGEEASTLITDLNNAVQDQLNLINAAGLSLSYYGNSNLQADLNNYLSAQVNSKGELEYEYVQAIIPILYEENGQYVNMRKLLLESSSAAFGLIGRGGIDSNDEFPDGAFLAVPTLDEVNEYIKAYLKRINNSDWENPLTYYQYYYLARSYGNILYLQNRIEVANAYLANSDIAKADVEALQTQIDDMKATFEAAKDEYAALEVSKTEAAEKCQALVNDATEKKMLLEHVGKDLETIISSLEAALAEVAYVAAGKPATWGPADIFGQQLESYIVQAESRLNIAKNNLADAQKNLEAWNNGETYNSVVEGAKNTLAYWNGALSIEQELLDLLKGRVDDLQKAYDKAAGNDTSDDNAGAEE